MNFCLSGLTFFAAVLVVLPGLVLGRPGFRVHQFPGLFLGGRDLSLDLFLSKPFLAGQPLGFSRHIPTGYKRRLTI